MRTGSEGPPRDRAALAAILVVAAALRLVHANTDYWFDEIETVVQWGPPAPLHDVLTQYTTAGHHVLYSVLMNAVTSVEPAPWAARLPAIAFGIAGVWAFWFAATQVWPRVPALAGTALYAVSYHHIYYSQDARGYTGLLFFGLLATALALRLMASDPAARRTRLRDGAFYAVAIALGLYTVLLMVFIAIGHGVVMLARRSRAGVAALAGGLALAGALYAPMVADVISFYRFNRDATGYPLLSADFARALAPLAAVGIIGTVAGIPVCLRLWRRNPAAAGLLLLPLAFNLIVPLAWHQGVYPRSFIFALAAAYLLQIELIDWLRAIRPSLAWGWVAVVSLGSLTLLVPYYQLPKQGFRQAVAHIDAHRAPSDERLGLTLAGKAVRFYDPSIVLVENMEDLRRRLAAARGGVWIVSTFPDQLRAEHPDMRAWVDRQPPVARFPGVIGDGTVEVRYWPPRQE